MKAIVTKFIPQTNTKPHRIRASAEGVYLVLSGTDHLEAARALASKMNWKGKVAEGGMPDGTSRVFVFIDKVEEF